LDSVPSDRIRNFTVFSYGKLIANLSQRLGSLTTLSQAGPLEVSKKRLVVPAGDPWQARQTQLTI